MSFLYNEMIQSLCFFCLPYNRLLARLLQYITASLDPLLKLTWGRLVLFPIQSEKTWHLYKKAMACSWTPEEINVPHDLQDWNSFTGKERILIGNVLAFLPQSTDYSWKFWRKSSRSLRRITPPPAPYTGCNKTSDLLYQQIMPKMKRHGQLNVEETSSKVLKNKRIEEQQNFLNSC